MRTEGNEDITMANIADLLDDAYSIGELKNILDKLASSSMPEGKAKKINPPKAE
jgi:hypothetical protein